MIRYRPQKGGFDESLQEMVTLPDAESVIQHIRELWPEYHYRTISTERYGFDSRPGWDSETYLVILGLGEKAFAIGYTDKPLRSIPYTEGD